MRARVEPLILGIDLGGTKILTAVADSHGNKLSSDRTATPAAEGLEAVIQAIIDSASRTLAQADITTDGLSAIGVGAPGLSNPETGVLFTSPHLPDWQDVPLREIIQKKLGKQTFLANDANAAALGELYYGAGRGYRKFVYITVSTGIGGGVIIDGKIYSGASGVAGEVGHMTIDVNGPPCRCGNNGCWESLASGTALGKEARRRITEGAHTSLLDYAGGEIEKVTAQIVHTAAINGDELSKELIARTGYYLGVGLANLVNIFNRNL